MKKFVLALTTAILLFSLTSTAFAGKISSSTEENPIQDEKMIQLIQELHEAQTKFDNLTDSQKKQIYKMTDKLNEQIEKIVEKYVKFGILSEDSAILLLDVLKDIKESAQEEGRSFFSLFPSCEREAEVDKTMP